MKYINARSLMMIEEYKETVLHELEKADDGNEVKQIINMAVERLP
jgi:hypothetical protein